MWNIDKREQAFAYYRQNGFQDQEALYKYIKNALGVHIPNATVCQGHCSPMDAIGDFFFQKTKSGFLWANRGGGKTKDIAILNQLDATFRKNCEIAHVAAEKFQSKQGLSYTKEMFKIAPYDKLLERDVQIETNLVNGSKIKILTGSLGGVNSQHPDKGRFDEVDLTTGPILEEFFCTAQSKSCPQCMNEPPEVVKRCSLCRGKGTLSIGQICLASTRKTMTGVMQNLLNDIDNKRRDIKMYEWCILESMQKCYDECSQCILYSNGCEGRCHNSNGFLTKNDAIKRFGDVHMRTWMAQYLNRKPDSSDLIYSDFDPDIHIVEYPYNQNLPTITCHDFGIKDWYVCLWLQYDQPNNTIYVVGETTLNNSPSSVYYRETVVKEASLGANVMWRVGDKRALSYMLEFAELGMQITPHTGNIDEGVDEIRKRLAPSMGQRPMLYIDKSCTHTINQFMTYSSKHLRGTIGQDDCMDALRYGVYAIKVYGFDLRPFSVAGERSLPEFARVRGTGFNESRDLKLTYK